MKRILIIHSLLLLSMVLFAAGQQEPAENVAFGSRDVTLKLVMEGNAEQQEWMQDLKEDFSSEHPNIKIEDIWLPMGEGGWGAYFTKIKTMIASGDSPDLVRVAVEGFRVLHDSRLALPLNDYITEHPEYVDDYEDIHPKLQEACTIDGNIYGFAWDWNNVVTHINMEMLRDAGLDFPSAEWDRDEFLRYAKALTREVDGQKVYGLFVPSYYFALEAWLYNFGGAFMNEAMDRGALDTPEAKEAFTFLHDLVYKHKVAPIPAPGDQFITMMTNRQVAMTFGGRWPVPAYMTAELDFDIQYVPSFRTNQVICGMGMFPVLSKSRYPEEAFILSSWLSGPHSQRTYLNTFSIPARVSVMDEVLPGNPPGNSILYKNSADYARVVQSPGRYPEVQQIIDRLFNEMMSTARPDMDGMLRSANEEITQVLAR